MGINRESTPETWTKPNSWKFFRNQPEYDGRHGRIIEQAYSETSETGIDLPSIEALLSWDNDYVPSLE